MKIYSAREKIIPHSYLMKYLFYDKDTGILYFKSRPRHHFNGLRAYRAWNSNYANKPTGSLTKRGYLCTSINNIRYPTHRLIWYRETGVPCKYFIDHIDGNRANNRLENLREASLSENAQNIHQLSAKNTSGYRGVHYYKQTNRWFAYISVNGKRKNLGYFINKENAIKARMQAEKELHPFSTSVNPVNQLNTRCLESNKRA